MTRINPPFRNKPTSKRTPTGDINTPGAFILTLANIKYEISKYPNIYLNHPTMKRLLLALGLSLCGICIFSQVFAPDGAVWYYTYDPDITLDDGYRMIEVEKDTLINGKTYKELKIYDIGYNHFTDEYYELDGGSIFVWIDDSIVYYLKSDTLYKLYDFTAQKSDSFWSIGFSESCENPYLITIDSISYVQHEQMELKKFYFHINQNETSSYYLERIGFTEYLLPIFDEGCNLPTGAHFPGPLRCYQDSYIGLFSTGVATDCDYITNEGEPSRGSEFKLFPNPTSSRISLVCPDNRIYSYELRSVFGSLIEQNSFKGQVVLDIQDIPSGLYMITLALKNSIIWSEKVIKY
jgi:hypothetical protein